MICFDPIAKAIQLTNTMMDPLSALIVGTIVVAATRDSRYDVQKCVEAYYSDKFNDHPSGKPTATFLTCMEKNFPTTFSETEKLYKPQNVTPQ